jgi:hypothetical protein
MRVEPITKTAENAKYLFKPGSWGRLGPVLPGSKREAGRRGRDPGCWHAKKALRAEAGNAEARSRGTMILVDRRG